MALDSYSARLGLIKEATGNNNNNWGDIFNASFTDLLDRALFGIDIHVVTGGTLDLSTGTMPPAGPSPIAANCQTFNGTLTAKQIVVLPALQGRWVFFNNTIGGFPLHLQVTGQATFTEIPNGKFVHVICDGTSIFRLDRDQVGRVIYHAGGTAPYGTMEIDGSSLLRTDHPDLFNAIGTTYGAADGTHFSLPNTKDTGRYIRSRSGSLAIGTAQANQNQTHSHTFSGTTSSVSNDHTHTFSGNTGQEGSTHSHTYTAPSGSNTSTGGGGFTVYNGGAPASTTSTGIESAFHAHSYSGTTSGASAFHTHTYSGTTSADGGTEARPESLVMMACILY